jgi:hypothetical protein
VKLLDNEKEVIKAMIIVNNNYQQSEEIIPANEKNNNNSPNNNHSKRKPHTPQENQHHTRLSLFITQQQLAGIAKGFKERNTLIERTRNPFAPLIEDKFDHLNLFFQLIYIYTVHSLSF